MVGIVVSGEIELLCRCAVVAPEGKLCAISEMILQVVKELQVDRELRHELMRPVACGVSLHHSDRVVLLLIRTGISGDGIGVAIGILVEVIGAVLLFHSSRHVGVGDGDRQDR